MNTAHTFSLVHNHLDSQSIPIRWPVRFPALRYLPGGTAGFFHVFTKGHAPDLTRNKVA